MRRRFGVRPSAGAATAAERSRPPSAASDGHMPVVRRLWTRPARSWRASSESSPTALATLA
eukprot:1236203-Prymnesium_polylepis.1